MTEEQKNSDIKEENTPQKRAWWEIPARGAVFFVILFVMMPGHWYRAAYLYTIGRLFPVSMESRISKISDKVQRRLDLQEIPSELRILVLKAEKQVELWGKMSSGTWKKINFEWKNGIAILPHRMECYAFSVFKIKGSVPNKGCSLRRGKSPF